MFRLNDLPNIATVTTSENLKTWMVIKESTTFVTCTVMWQISQQIILLEKPNFTSSILHVPCAVRASDYNLFVGETWSCCFGAVMQGKTLTEFNFLCEIFSQRFDHFLFILVKKYLVQGLSSEKQGGYLPELGCL